MHDGIVVVQPAVVSVAHVPVEVMFLAIANIVLIDVDEVSAILPGLLVKQADGMADLVNHDPHGARSLVDPGMP